MKSSFAGSTGESRASFQAIRGFLPGLAGNEAPLAFAPGGELGTLIPLFLFPIPAR
jgi:hypothetical protein